MLSVIGGFTVKSVTWGTADELMGIKNSDFRITRESLVEYLNRDRGAAIEVDATFWLRRPVDRVELDRLGNGFSSPQSFRFIHNESVVSHLQKLALLECRLPTPVTP
jgi:predicted transcriptional regulator